MNGGKTYIRIQKDSRPIWLGQKGVGWRMLLVWVFLMMYGGLVKANESANSPDPLSLTTKAICFDGINNYGLNSVTNGIPTGNAHYSWEIWVNAAVTTGDDNRITNISHVL